jgi:hypothetical protein
MFKTSLIAAAAAIAMLSPAYAASDECTDAHMQLMREMIAGMTDEAQKKEATKQIDMSEAEMKKGNEAGCMEHMDAAHKAMGL